MLRKSRIDAPGAMHHIIARGIERCKIFRDDADCNNFLDRLSLGRIINDTVTVMRRLLTGYAVSHSRHHGHLFQNRYKSILCQEDAYLLELVRYIHLNPVCAELVSDIKALDWISMRSLVV